MQRLGGLQIIFQDPYSAVNPKFTVEEVILEPIKINKIWNEAESETRLQKVLEETGVDVDRRHIASRLSGGQLQKVTIARALIMQPKLLIADEITSNLDISAKVNLLRMLKKLQNKHGFSMIYITHDIKMAKKISEKIAIMKNGEIIEQGPAHHILYNPTEKYTKELLSENSD